MKKGISLIVLVITIIVMIIIAGAIIISLNSSNVIGQANDAVRESNIANARSVVALTYAEILGDWYAENPTTPYIPDDAGVTKINAALQKVNGKDYTFTVQKTATGYDLYLGTEKLDNVEVATSQD